MEHLSPLLYVGNHLDFYVVLLPISNDSCNTQYNIKRIINIKPLIVSHFFITLLIAKPNVAIAIQKKAASGLVTIGQVRLWCSMISHQSVR